MKYLFFDTECANSDGGKGKICSFGFALADQSLGIIDSGDILINPNSTWHWYVRKKIISYPVSEFLNKPTFDGVYNTLRTMLECDDTIVLGYNVEADLGYLADECLRYCLPPITVRAVEVQLLYRHFFELSQPLALEKAASTLGLDAPLLVKHNSRDDALMTLAVFDGLTKRFNITPTAALDMVERQEAQPLYLSFEKIYSDKRAARELEEILQTTPASTGKLKGERLCFEKKLLTSNAHFLCALLRKIYKQGGCYTESPASCTTFVYSGEEASDKNHRYALLRSSRGEKIKLISLKSLESSMNE